MVATAPVVDRPALGQSRGDRSLTVAAPRGRVVRRAAPARAERAVPPEMELPELAATEIAPPAPPAAQAEDPPLRMVQLATADPNVVIYWLLEDRGERR